MRAGAAQVGKLLACTQYTGSCAHGELVANTSRTQHDHCGSCAAGYSLVNKACAPNDCAAMVPSDARSTHHIFCEIAHTCLYICLKFKTLLCAVFDTEIVFYTFVLEWEPT